MLPSPEEMKSGPALRNPVAVGLPSLIFMPISGSGFDSPLQEGHPSMCVGWTVPGNVPQDRGVVLRFSVCSGKASQGIFMTLDG